MDARQFATTTLRFGAQAPPDHSTRERPETQSPATCLCAALRHDCTGRSAFAGRRGTPACSRQCSPYLGLVVGAVLAVVVMRGRGGSARGDAQRAERELSERPPGGGRGAQGRRLAAKGTLAARSEIEGSSGRSLEVALGGANRRARGAARPGRRGHRRSRGSPRRDRYADGTSARRAAPGGPGARARACRSDDAGAGPRGPAGARRGAGAARRRAPHPHDPRTGAHRVRPTGAQHHLDPGFSAPPPRTPHRRRSPASRCRRTR
jgi:hypothetical protein